MARSLAEGAAMGGGRRGALRGLVMTCCAAAVLMAALWRPGVAHAANDRPIVFGADQDFPPWECEDSTGEAVGFHPDLIRAIGRTMGFQVEIRSGPWQEIRQQLVDGTIDVVGMVEQPVRRDYAEFGDPYTVTTSEIFVRRDGPHFDSLADLDGHEVVVQAGALADEELTRNHPNIKLYRATTEADALRMLASGKHDACIVTQFGGRTAIKRFELGNLTTSGPLVMTSNYSLCVRKGDTELLKTLNQGLAIIKETGEFNRLYTKWFGGVERPSVPVRRLLVYAAWIIAPLLGITTASLIWSRSLRRKVAERTASLSEELQHRRELEARQAIMVAELDHRVRNSLASVLAMSDQMLSTARSLPEFRTAFTERVRAMASAHELLTRARWEGMRLEQAVRSMVEPFTGPNSPRVAVSGDNPLLPPSVATPLCMVLHELATNAAQHGALSTPSGTLSVTGLPGSGNELALVWCERSATIREGPMEPGFGLTLVRGMIEHQLRGSVSCRRTDGELVWEIRVPSVSMQAHAVAWPRMQPGESAPV